ncbi:MAG TPA: S8 family serine peptidase, partial [Vicinamibacterales bacterium]|nr:S8 family serine peptidase [Vicinamibacterales bacterium]
GQAPQASSRDVIVVFYDDERDVDGLAAQHGHAYGAEISARYHSALKGYAAKIPNARIDDVRRDPRVAFVSDDRAVEAFAQTLPTGVDRIDGELSPHYASNDWSAASNVVATAVAVIDTGSGPHADLNVVGGVSCQPGKSFSDGNGHGTHVAGTIGAINNGSGVVGVAPGIPIYSVRVLDNRGSGRFSDIICGIDWVTANASRLNIKVANMSLGGAGSDDGNCGNTNRDALHKAICSSVAAGVTYVVAAGNDGANMAGSVPASYNEVLSVTAAADFNGQAGGGAAATCRADVDDTPADFSNFATPGSLDEMHTIAAPGVCIYSTWKGGGYNTISGTSMASPHAAGVAALCIASGQCTGTPADVIARLRSNAAAQELSYGFEGDPNHNPAVDRAYGYLLRAGGY